MASPSLLAILRYLPFSSRLMNVNELTDMPVRETKIAGIPLTVRLYADDWTWNDVWYAFFTGRHEWNCRWPALLLPDERTYAPRQRNHDRHQARTILRGVSTGGGYTSFASNGPGSTATLAASCRGRNSPDAFINFAESQR